MIGCAGGIPGQVNQFDVVFADRVYYYEPGKDSTNGYLARPDLHRPFQKMIEHAKLASMEDRWKRLIPSQINTEFHARVEPIAAGEQLLNSHGSLLQKHIAAISGRAVAVEQEGYGVLIAAHTMGINGVVVRGISDLMDKPPEDSTKINGSIANLNQNQFRATQHAAAFFAHVLGTTNLGTIVKDKEPIRSEFLIEVLVNENQFPKVIEHLNRLSSGLRMQNIRIILGSVKVAAEVDAVFGVVIETLWKEGLLRYVFEPEVGYVTASSSSEPLASNLADIIVQFSRRRGSREYLISRMRKIGKAHPPYRLFLRTIEGGLNRAIDHHERTQDEPEVRQDEIIEADQDEAVQELVSARPTIMVEIPKRDPQRKLKSTGRRKVPRSAIPRRRRIKVRISRSLVTFIDTYASDNELSRSAAISDLLGWALRYVKGSEYLRPLEMPSAGRGAQIIVADDGSLQRAETQLSISGRPRSVRGQEQIPAVLEEQEYDKIVEAFANIGHNLSPARMIAVLLERECIRRRSVPLE